MRLLLIRHGEPDQSAQGRCYGRLEVGLSAAGARQADELARELASTHVDLVMSSPSGRAVATARRLGTAPVLDDRLHELDFGLFEGRSYDELQREEPALFERWMEAPTSVAFPGGESFHNLRSRARDLVRELRARRGAEVVAVVTHGGVVRAILGDALRLAAEDVFRLDIGYCRVSVVDLSDHGALVRQVNGTARDLPAAGAAGGSAPPARRRP